MAKTFYERASWPAVLLSIAPLVTLAAALFHAAVVVGTAVVAAGGQDLTGVALLRPLPLALDLTAVAATLAADIADWIVACEA